MTIEELLRFRARPVHIIGISGAEGFAVFRFLRKLSFQDIRCHDLHEGEQLRRSFFQAHVSIPKSRRETAFRELLESPARFMLGRDYLEGIHGAALVAAPQNWQAHPANAPLKEVRARGTPFVFMIQLYLANSPAPVIGVTGTNGKTTVCSLLEHILRTAGVPSLLSGNDRYHPQRLDALDTLSPDGFLVLEISNRQLRETRRSPHIAVLTNVQGDHISEHGSLEAYTAVKKKIFRFQSDSDFAVLNADDPVSRRIAGDITAKRYFFSTERPVDAGAGPVGNGFGIVAEGERIELFAADALKIPGKHNVANALAAALAAWLGGVNPQAIRDALLSFPGVRNRIQHIATLDGVDYYNDLASTNPSATRRALESFRRPAILLCGGDMKGNAGDYAHIQAAAGRVKHLILLPGTASDALANLFPSRRVSFADSLEQAVRRAESIAGAGDVVLLSPSGAGFYSRFVAGKKGFRRLVRDLERKRHATRAS